MYIFASTCTSSTLSVSVSIHYENISSCNKVFMHFFFFLHLQSESRMLFLERLEKDTGEKGNVCLTLTSVQTGIMSFIILILPYNKWHGRKRKAILYAVFMTHTLLHFMSLMHCTVNVCNVDCCCIALTDDARNSWKSLDKYFSLEHLSFLLHFV